MAAATWYEIGVNLAGAVSLISLGIPGVESEFIDFVESRTLSDGQERKRGLPQVRWNCGYLTSTQFAVFRTLCLGASASVCIATLNNDLEFVRYNCIMKVPGEYRLRDDKAVDFVFEFSHLVEAE